VEVADAALDDPLLDVASGVGHGHVLTPAQHGGEALLGGRELEELDDVAVLVEPCDRRPDAELDAVYGIGLVGDGGLLTFAQLALGVAQDLEEQLLLGREVPVEDALAHAQSLHDLGDRGGVVAVLGEAGRGVRHQLLTTFPAPLGEAAIHRGNGRDDLTERSRTPLARASSLRSVTYWVLTAILTPLLRGL